MQELTDFYNEGFGWICRQCERELTAGRQTEPGLARIFREGEAEKDMVLSSHALARWADAARTVLMCPRCGLTESVDKS